MTLVVLAALAASTGAPVRVCELPLPAACACVLATGIPSIPFLLGLEDPGGIELVFRHEDGSFGMLRIPGFGCPDMSMSPLGCLAVCRDRAPAGVLLLHRGDDSLREAPLPAFLDRPENVEMEDMDGDGDEDLLLVDHDPGVVAVIAEDGGGEACVIMSAGAGLARAVVPFDADSDGMPDMAWCGCLEGTSILCGSTGLDPAGAVRAGTVGMKDLAALDWDGDGDCDLAAAPCCSASVRVFENLGGGGWEELTVPLEAVPKSVSAAFLDGDPLPDMVVTMVEAAGGGLAGLRNPGCRPGGEWTTLFRLPGSYTAACFTQGPPALLAACTLDTGGAGCALRVYLLE